MNNEESLYPWALVAFQTVCFMLAIHVQFLNAILPCSCDQFSNNIADLSKVGLSWRSKAVGTRLGLPIMKKTN